MLFFTLVFREERNIPSTSMHLHKLKDLRYAASQANVVSKPIDVTSYITAVRSAYCTVAYLKWSKALLH